MLKPLVTSYKNLWDDAVDTANYIRNRMYREGCQREGVTLIEALTGIKPDVSNLRIFGCPEYFSIPYQLRVRKIESKAHNGMMVGYLGVAYIVFILETGRIFI